MVKMESVRVRFAPSPSGNLHIGGARTALFNWLFAKHHQGSFILRIEDTDVSRTYANAARVAIESMRWLGLNWDDEIIRQSERLSLYKGIQNQLLESGKAYNCDCDPELKKAERRCECRLKGVPRSAKTALRFKTPESGTTRFRDMIRGELTFQNEEIEDFVIARSDGTPTYNLAAAVDDSDMRITHVIRGDDHINNTPKQILLYEALKMSLPEFAHLPQILGPDRTRLSKRHGAESVLVYRERGYLPEAMINCLARLSWGHGDREIFSREELIEFFSLDSVIKSPAIFDPEKLKWLNLQHIKMMPDEKLKQYLEPFLDSHAAATMKSPLFDHLLQLLKPRSETLNDMKDQCRFFFRGEPDYDEKAVTRYLKPSKTSIFPELMDMLDRMDEWSVSSLESGIRKFLEQREMKLSKVAQPVRVALTGSTKSPGLFDVIYVLGRGRVKDRLSKFSNND